MGHGVRRLWCPALAAGPPPAPPAARLGGGHAAVGAPEAPPAAAGPPRPSVSLLLSMYRAVKFSCSKSVIRSRGSPAACPAGQGPACSTDCGRPGWRVGGWVEGTCRALPPLAPAEGAEENHGDGRRPPFRVGRRSDTAPLLTLHTAASADRPPPAPPAGPRWRATSPGAAWHPPPDRSGTQTPMSHRPHIAAAGRTAAADSFTSRT